MSSVGKPLQPTQSNTPPADPESSSSSSGPLVDQSETLPKPYKSWRFRIFLAMLLSYATYYLTRFSFPFCAPVMQNALNLTIQDIGLISSCFPVTYGISKLFGGVVADLASPRIVLSTGLFLTALCNFIFASSSSVWIFALLWGLNGIVSSVGFPACAKLLSVWFSQAERGTYWGMLNISLNVGGGLSPIIVGTVVAASGWRFGLVVPGVIAVCMGLISYFVIADSPKEAGLPATKLLVPPEPKDSERNPIKAFRTQLVDGVLQERAVWYLAAAYFFVYIIRQALSTWTVFYLMQVRGIQTISEAALRVSGLEVGGLLGSISSGWLSDYLIRKNPKAGAIGQRVRIILLYLVLMAAAMTAFFIFPGNNGIRDTIIHWLLFSLTGMGLYGPQLLVGLCSSECVNRKYAGTSNGFVGLAAYTGASLAGLPLSICVKTIGWNAFYFAVIACCLLVALLVIPLSQKSSFDQQALDKSQI